MLCVSNLPQAPELLAVEVMEHAQRHEVVQSQLDEVSEAVRAIIEAERLKVSPSDVGAFSGGLAASQWVRPMDHWHLLC